MKQKRINSTAVAIGQATLAIAGATALGATGPTNSTAAVITADKTAFVASIGVYDGAVREMSTRQATLVSVRSTVRAFAMQARDSLKPRLGNQHSQAWNGVGFVGTLQVPEKLALLKLLLLKLAAYLADVPAAEILEINITAARAQALYDQLVAAEDAVALQRGAVRGALLDKNAKFEALAKRLRHLAKELSTILPSLSQDWLKFGLNIPGLKETPEIPANVIAALIGPNAVALKWDAAARAERYRVWKKVVGVDEEFVLVETREELDLAIEGLPANKTIQIAVSAVNNGGESALSQFVTVTTA